MPFFPQWRSYSKGDLLYGLSNERTYLAIQFGLKDSDIYTIDDYSLFSEQKNKYELSTFLKWDPEFVKTMKEHIKYSEVFDFYDEHKDQRLADDSNGESIPEEVKLARDAVAKRKSKCGILYIVHNTEFHIHFQLAGIKMKPLVRKTHSKDSFVQFGGQEWHEKGRSITGSELRWVFRHRFDLKVQNKLQFWCQDPEDRGQRYIQCSPPWDSSWPKPGHRKAWDEYGSLA
jgi:hypothetical protein